MKKKAIHGGNIYVYKEKMLDFSANLNPLGMPPEVKRAVIENIDRYESYPDPDCTELVAAIAEYTSVPKEYIVCGNGAADVIYRTVLAVSPKKALIVSPTFSEYEEALDTAGCSVEHFFLKEENGFKLGEAELDELCGAVKGLDMLFLCNPNNPTGIPVERGTVLRLARACEEHGTVLFLDECFNSFLPEWERYTVADELAGLPHTIVLKAFTKLYAMAGLRLGYCLCSSPDVVSGIRQCLQSWPVSTAAAVAGVAALKLKDLPEKTRSYVEAQRELLKSGLRALGFCVYDSQANYVFFKSDIPLTEALKARGILIRSCANYPSLSESFYRIAVRTAEENERLLAALSDITGKKIG